MSYTQEQARSWTRKSHERRDDNYRPTYPSARNGGSFDERRRDRSPVSRGYKRSLSPSPPASPSGTRNAESRRDSRFDLQPFSKSVTAAPQPRKVVPGVIMNFPAGVKSRSKILRDQPWVNDRATGHPVMVWDTYRWEGEDYARCLPMTSLNGESPEKKYPHAWRHHLRYVPISQGGEITKSRTNMPMLTLAENGRMDQQTYVHLDHFFDIEVKYLRPRGRDANSLVPLQLDNAALNVLVFKLQQFIQGEVWRPGPGGVKSPLYYKDLPYPELGRPRLEDEVKERARIGRELETARYEKDGTREWTGHERGGESPRKRWWEPVDAAVRPFSQKSGSTQWGGPRRLFQG